MSPLEKNKEGLKDTHSCEAREKEAPFGNIRDPKRAEAEAEISPGRAQEQEQSQTQREQTNPTGSSTTPPDHTPHRKKGERKRHQGDRTGAK